MSFTLKVGNKIQRAGGMVCEIKLLATGMHDFKRMVKV